MIEINMHNKLKKTKEIMKTELKQGEVVEVEVRRFGKIINLYGLILSVSEEGGSGIWIYEIMLWKRKRPSDIIKWKTKKNGSSCTEGQSTTIEVSYWKNELNLVGTTEEKENYVDTENRRILEAELETYPKTIASRIVRNIVVYASNELEEYRQLVYMINGEDNDSFSEINDLGKTVEMTLRELTEKAIKSK